MTLADLPLGVTVDEASIIAFASAHDPQPFHLDAGIAARFPLKGLAASGWQTGAIALKLLADATTAPFVLQGIDELRWISPVRPGDRLILVGCDTGRIQSEFEEEYCDVVLATASGREVLHMRCHLSGRSRRSPSARLRPSVWGDDVLALAGPLDEVDLGTACPLGTGCCDAEAVLSFEAKYRGARTEPGCVPRWLVATSWMRRYVQSRDEAATERRRLGLPVVAGGPSPGFTELRFSRDVAIGERLFYGLTVSEKRKTWRSGWAIVSAKCALAGADGNEVASFTGQLTWPC